MFKVIHIQGDVWLISYSCAVMPSASEWWQNNISISWKEGKNMNMNMWILIPSHGWEGDFFCGGREGVTTTSDESTWQPLRYLQYVPTSSNHTSSTKHDKSHLMHRLLHRGKDTKGIRCRIEDGLEVRRRWGYGSLWFCIYDKRVWDFFYMIGWKKKKKKKKTMVEIVWNNTFWRNGIVHWWGGKLFSHQRKLDVHERYLGSKSIYNIIGFE